MGTYEDLKNAIADVIYTNGNNEITGIVLQQILQRVVSTIGINATFAGIATPDTDPGEIDQNVIYVATQPGIYDNFNGQNITSGIGIFSNKNGVWEYMDLGLQTDLSKSVTYTELVTLRNDGNLTPGMLYRITDYNTTTAQTNTQTAGHPFDIIVLALSESELSEQVWAVQSARDTDGYFANSQLSAWKIWYCLDNDTSRFAWADATNGKGVIYRMIDEWNNDCPYDFKNIQFRHPANTTTDSNYYYTFSTVLSGVVSDHSLRGGYYCYENKIGFRIIVGNQQQLNNIVFINTLKTSSCYFNSFGNNCYDNSFGNSCISNSFGDYCYSNSFGIYCNNNRFGNHCTENSFGNSCQSNSFGDYCYLNSFGNSCQYNSFGNSCHSISFGDSCNSNSFGNSFRDNSFGNSCQSNSFGNNCYDNSFGNSCISNSFGSYCNHNNFGNYCHYNSFGSACVLNIFGDYYSYNRLENGVSSMELYNIQTASSNQQVQNYHLTWGLDSKTIEVERNRAYETTVAIDSEGNVKQFCIADIIL